MARVKFGDGVSGQTGSLNKNAGGVTYLKNNVKRMRVVPTNPQTASQGLTRGAFAFFTTAWKNLTEVQKEAWESARTGSAYYATQDDFYGVSRPVSSAKSLFIAMNYNVNLMLDQLATPAVEKVTPGTSSGTDTIGITSFDFDASSGTAVLTYSGTPAEETLVISATPPVSAGNMRVPSIKSKMRILQVAPAASPAALGTAYTNLFGAITAAAGQKVFWSVNAIDADTGKSRFVAQGNSIIAA